jgi:hypothetical protein
MLAREPGQRTHADAAPSGRSDTGTFEEIHQLNVDSGKRFENCTWPGPSKGPGLWPATSVG